MAACIDLTGLTIAVSTELIFRLADRNLAATLRPKTNENCAARPSCLCVHDGFDSSNDRSGG